MPAVTPVPRSTSPWASAFPAGRRYLASATMGLPPRTALAALRADLDAAASGRPDIASYTATVERARASYARLVGVDVERVAIGSQTSAMSALVATAVPDGGEVLIAAGDFSSIVMPFSRTGRRLRVRTAPLRALADEIRSDTALVVFSLVQSATGEVADEEAIRTAARRHGARTYCDVTQAAGWMPVVAGSFDATVCHTYKWLCAPRGVTFLTLTREMAATMTPLAAGWYAGEDPWATCYGDAAPLAASARRFDVSPTWQAFVGAAPSLDLFASASIDDVFRYTTGLATDFRASRGLPEPRFPSAIVTWADPGGDDLRRLSAAGITASGRAGRARVSFHLFNDAADVQLATRALGG